MQTSDLTPPAVFAVGETVLDIIFRDGQVQAARAGGSMLNSAVSLGRCGIHVSLISETGQDQTGNMIKTFLENNGVQTRYLHQYNEMKTALAMAFLDERGDASYDFYKNYPAQRLSGPLPRFEPNTLLLFGSWFGIDPALRSRLQHIMEAARKAGSILYYDPNFRRPHLKQLPLVKPFILENMAAAHIIRASHEDLELIFGISTLEEWEVLPQVRGKVLILTRAAGTAELRHGPVHIQLPAQPVQVVSTIGAGDNFNAGIIYGLLQQQCQLNTMENFSPEQWKEILRLGLTFAAASVQSYDNWVPEGFTPATG